MMKREKMKLDGVKIKSFVTGEQQKIQGGITQSQICGTAGMYGCW